MRRNIKRTCDYYPPAYALRPGPFRTYHACEGKISYHFLYEDGQFSNPDYDSFLQTQLLANKLLNGMDGYVFYVQIFVETVHHFTLEEIPYMACWKDEQDIGFLSCENIGGPSALQKFTFFTENLNAISQNKKLFPVGDIEGSTGIFADYYAIRANDLPHEELYDIKNGADFALISDDTHGVWTILRTEKYPQDLLIENLEQFCKIHSAKLNIYV